MSDSFGDQAADFIAARVGSWPFIIAQSCGLLLWIILNVVLVADRWDPYPFILLNLALSFQAAYTGPIVMISQNRQAARDRQQDEARAQHIAQMAQHIEQTSVLLTVAAKNVEQMGGILDGLARNDEQHRINALALLQIGQTTGKAMQALITQLERSGKYAQVLESPCESTPSESSQLGEEVK